MNPDSRMTESLPAAPAAARGTSIQLHKNQGGMAGILKGLARVLIAREADFGKISRRFDAVLVGWFSRATGLIDGENLQ